MKITESKVKEIIREELLNEFTTTGIDVPRIVSLRRPAKKRSKAKDPLKRIENADCVFVSWNTKLTSSILSNTKNLKYIGMCCSLYENQSSNIDIEYCEKIKSLLKE